MGSSKGMESILAVEILKELKKEGYNVSTLDMDNDSTTFVKAKEVFPFLEKKSDANHTKKSISSQLYKLQDKVPLLKNTDILNYIVRNITYCLYQNQGNSLTLQDSLNNVVPHMYGEHDKCGDWCMYKADPENYRHNSLPGGKPLSDKGKRK